MIDNFSILFSTVAVVYVILRAIKLDRLMPWFGSTRPETTTEAADGKTRPVDMPARLERAAGRHVGGELP